MVKSYFRQAVRSEVYQTVRSKMSRWCFSNLNEISNSTPNISLKTYPNYSISKGVILQETKLPKNMKKERLEISIDDQIYFKKMKNAFQ